MSPDKLFIDIDEEIIFTLEKIRESESERVILVVPERALLMGSAVSLKLLGLETAHLKKIPVVVTTDGVGVKLGTKAGLVVVEKAADITEEIWKKAKELNEHLLHDAGNKKEELINERHAPKIIANEPIVEDIKEIAKQPEEIADSKVPEISEVKTPKPIEPKPAWMNPKIIDVEGYTFVAGGDIKDFHELVHNDVPANIADNGSELKTNEIPSKTLPADNQSPADAAINKIKSIEAGRYIELFSEKFREFFTGGSSKKWFTRVAIVVIIFYLISYFFLSSGDVSLYIESRDSTVSENITADTSVESLDLDTLTIPAKYLEKNFDISDSAATTVEADTGNQATGEIGVFNKTSEAITLPAGTTFQEKVSGNLYISNFNATIPAATDSDSGINFGYLDIGVTASTFGEAYNTDGKNLNYAINGYTDSEITAKNFKDIKGGTTRKVKVTSQADADKLRTQLLEKIKPQALQGLKELAGGDSEIAESSFTTEVVNETITPEIGKESDTLNLSITVKGKVLSFAKKDLDPLAAELVSKTAGDSLQVEKYEYNPKVNSVVENKVDITLDITAVVSPTVDADAIKEELKGASLSDSEGILRGKEEIKDYKLNIGPFWMPSFLKHMPGDASKINIKVGKA